MSVTWTVVCPFDRLQPERGVAALLVGGEQVAVFLTHDGELFAIGNQDPISGAYVMSRGIVGTRSGAPTVASPMHKQVYDLRNGECLDVAGVRLPVYPVRCRAGQIEIGDDVARSPLEQSPPQEDLRPFGLGSG
jgi:nitrite reductase (NADH) small subunit